MAEDPRKRLSALLGEQAVEATAALDDDEVARLADAVERAQKAQRAALRDAAEESLGFIPRFLRGTAKKIVFG